MDACSFDVLAASSDRSLLRRLSQFLSAHGYTVRQTANLRQLQDALESARPDFLLLDEVLAHGGGLELCRSLGGQNQAGCLLSLLLTERPDVGQLQAAIAAGIDDFLAKPLVYGEILARLRAGARTLEFERRAREQAGLEPLTGLLSKSAFLAGLSDVLTPASGKPRRTACVALDLDFFSRVNARFGRTAGDELLRSVALHLVEHAGENAMLACLGGGSFAALLPNTGSADGRAWAERVRASLTDAEFNVGEETIRISASFGVAEPCQEPCTPAELLRQAETAQRSAKCSGRDCVALAGEFDAETRAWTEMAASDRLFAQTLARDVMQPCTLAVSNVESVDQALGLLRQFHVPVVPVVDGHGKLVGTFSPEKDLGGQRGSRRLSGLVKDVMTKLPGAKPEDAPLSAVVDFFEHGSESMLFVVHDNSPVGLITRASLAALRTPPSRADFAPSGGFSSESEYLVVSA